MRVLYVCLLSACIVGFAYALPPRYSRYSVEDSLDDDEESSVEDEAYDDMNGVFTFPTGGPGGPPSNKYMSHMERGRTDMDDEGVYVLDVDPEYLYGLSGEELDSPTLNPELARQLLRKEKEPQVEDEEEQEDEEDEEEEDDDAGDQDDDSDDEQFGIPDYNKMFPNPQGRPQGPGDYQAYVKHMPQNQQGNQQNQRGSPPPQRRYRTENALTTYINNPNDDYVYDDAVVVDAYQVDRSRILQNEQGLDEDEEADDDEDDEEVDDDVDFSVPSYDTLFPTPSNKQISNSQLFSGMKNSWNNAPQPPNNRRQQGYGRLVRLLQSPMLHDMYNPDYVIDPTIALNRRNERLRYRYSNPNWRRRNILTPYNYKPILYQKGHWGNPREHDYNPISGDHYLGGIYNGKNYY